MLCGIVMDTYRSVDIKTKQKAIHHPSSSRQIVFFKITFQCSFAAVWQMDRVPGNAGRPLEVTSSPKHPQVTIITPKKNALGYNTDRSV